MEPNNNNGMDLGYVFNLIGRSYRSFLIFVYNKIQFLLRNWILVLLLAIVGAVLGYFANNYFKPAKESTLIVQINFNAANYVYDAVEQLNKRIKENDTLALRALGFYPQGKLGIYNVEIEPIVNIIDILRKTPSRGNNMEVLVEKASFKEDLLASEVFNSDYHTHRIHLVTSGFADDKIVTALIDYFNANEILNEIKEVTIKTTKRKIAGNLKSISYMDSIFKAYGTIAKNPPTNQLYFNTYSMENANVHLMFREKTIIQDDTEDLEVELLKYNNIVEVINKPTLQEKQRIFKNKMLLYPILFVFIFSVLMWLKSLFNTAKKLSEKKNIIEL